MADIFLYTDSGKTKGRLKLDLDIQEKKQSLKTHSCVIRKLRQSWRQGTVGCKGRGDVAFSSKKPWKQKGTGRARAGSLRSPLWRKGGVIFGPQSRTRFLFINKKQNRYVLNNTFFDSLNNGAISSFDFSIDGEVPNTKIARVFLKNAGLFDKKIVLFLSFADELNFASFRNLVNVDVLSFDQPNAFDLSGRHWVFLKKDFDLFKKMVTKWN